MMQAWTDAKQYSRFDANENKTYRNKRVNVLLGWEETDLETKIISVSFCCQNFAVITWMDLNS